MSTSTPVLHKFYLSCCWMEHGHLTIDAVSPEDAVEQAKAMFDLPLDAAYVEDTFRVLNVQLPQ